MTKVIEYQEATELQFLVSDLFLSIKKIPYYDYMKKRLEEFLKASHEMTLGQNVKQYY